MRKIGYPFAGIVISVALLVVASRLLIPVLDKHRADFEVWASSFLDMPVKIEEARVSWYQYQPVITLNRVTILNKTSHEPILQIDKLRVFFSIPQSIWNWKPILSGIMVAGVDVNLYEKPNGDIAVQGFPAIGGLSETPYTAESKLADIITWLGLQPRLMLHNVFLSYVDKRGNKRYLTLLDLRFANHGDRHTVKGKVILRQDKPTELTAKIEWFGNSPNINDIDADIYFDIAGFSLSQWLKGVTLHDWQLKTGISNARVWATWRKGVFTQVQSTFEAYGLSLYSAFDKSTHKILRLSGDVGWKRVGDTYIIAGDDVFVDLPNRLWPSSSFYIALAPDANKNLVPTTVNFGYLNLEDVQHFLSSQTPMLPEAVITKLNELKLTGDIQSFASNIPEGKLDGEHISFNTHFAHVGIMPSKTTPGIVNLSGVLNMQGAQGNLELQSEKTTVRLDSVFAKPLTFANMTGKVTFQKQKNDWLLSLDKVRIANDDVILNLNGTIDLLPTTKPVMNLAASFVVPQLKNIKNYMPMKLFEPDLEKWLSAAFLGGQISAGTAQIRGNLQDFPFAEHNGEFSIQAKVNNVDFHFAPNWPIMNKVNGKLGFSGDKIIIDVSDTNIMDIPIENVHGLIENLSGAKPSMLSVTTNVVHTDFQKGFALVHASPLEKTVGKMFKKAELYGDITLKLGLTVPLAKAEDTTVSGDIAFNDASIKLEAWRLQASKLHGGLHFTENTTEAKNITGLIFEKPFQLQLTTLHADKAHSTTRAIITNHLDIADLEAWLKMPLSKAVNGSTDVVVDLDFQIDAPMLLHAESNLLGVNVLLPDQYAKTASQPKKFTLDLVAEDNQPLKLKMNYAKQLDVAFILEDENNSFDLVGANVSLGAGVAAWPKDDGLYVSGNIAELSWEKIKSYADGKSGGSVKLGDLSLRGVDVQIGKLNLPSFPLTSVRLTLIPDETSWDVGINSAELSGHVQLPMKWSTRETIKAQFDKINIGTQSADNQSTSKFDSATLPSIIFSAENVEYNHMSIGRVNFKTTSNGAGMIINSISVNAPRLSLNASGSWHGSTTKLSGTATSSNVSQFFESLGFDMHNFVSSDGKVDFQFTWSKPPFALSLAAMSGQASISLGKGRIVEIGQTSGAKMDIGRMLNIFSLQTIPRRLSLDFSDVFQKGYSFDTFRGDFRFENGNAFTSNTAFNGPVAKVAIDGRIGLVARDYALTLSVTPYVTSSIPVAATLLTGQPVIGIAAWAVDKVISSGVSKVTTYHYEVKGPWSNPSWNSTSSH